MYSLYFHVLSPIGLLQGLLYIDNKSNSSWDLCKSFINPARAHIISEAQHTFDKERLSPAISAHTLSVCFHHPKICKPYVPRAGSPRYGLVPRAGSPCYILVPRAASPGYIFVHRAGSPRYSFVPRAVSPKIPSCT